MRRTAAALGAAMALIVSSSLNAQTSATIDMKGTATMSDTTTTAKKSDKEWETCLTAEQYRVLREKGTERAFTGKYYNEHAKGTYKCAGCGAELFKSDTKFESGTGWPSFFAPMPGSVKTESDTTHGMNRTEAMCAKCGGHLGHVFDDGPQPTGQRFCINSASLDLEKAKE